MSTPTLEPDHLSTEEVRAAIEALSEADRLRLDKTARCYSTDRLQPDDLLHTAIMRALEGTRRCPRGVSVVRFLAEAMRSIASDDAKAQYRKPELRLVPKDGEDAEKFDIPDSAPNAESTLSEEQETRRIINEISALFEDDIVALTVVQGIMEDMEAEELCELTGLDRKAYASKRRLIRRRIDQAFPEGWNR